MWLSFYYSLIASIVRRCGGLRWINYQQAKKVWENWSQDLLQVLKFPLKFLNVSLKYLGEEICWMLRGCENEIKGHFFYLFSVRFEVPPSNLNPMTVTLIGVMGNPLSALH